jgi:hypothetical protein
MCDEWLRFRRVSLRAITYCTVTEIYWIILQLLFYNTRIGSGGSSGNSNGLQNSSYTVTGMYVLLGKWTLALYWFVNMAD